MGRFGKAEGRSVMKWNKYEFCGNKWEEGG